jgi:hypothetical protein
MILRRITEHVKAQNWTAVALDFVIVVVGVLFAFQITAWNAAWNEQKRADAALAALLIESGESVVYLEDQVAMIDESIADQRASIEALIAGELQPGMSHEDFIAGVTLTRRFLAPHPPRSTYDSLLSNGDISLIEDANVLRALASYYARIAQVKDYATRIAASNISDYHPAIISIYDPLSENFRRQDADFAALASDSQFLEDSVDILRSVTAVQSARKNLLEISRETHMTICSASRQACDNTTTPHANINERDN